jgi:general secretion pathway protein L
MAQTILGIDLGRRAVKAVLLASAYRGFTVAGHAQAPVEPAVEGGPSLRERQVAALGRLLAAQGWRPDATVVAFPGAGVAAHVVTLPFTDARRIEQTIGFEVEGQIPYELSEAAWDWQVLSPRPGVTDLWVGVAPRAELTGLLTSLGAVGVDPRIVAPAAPTLAALLAAGALGEAAAGELPAGRKAREAPKVQALAAGEPAPVEAVLDLGEERTLLCLASGGVLETARSVAQGSGAVTRVLARELGLGEADVAALLAAEAGGPAAPEHLVPLSADPRAAEALGRALQPLVRELRASLRAWRTRVGARPVSRLWLAGGLARLPGLAELLAAELEAPVLPLTLAGPAAEGLPPEEAPSLALALAAALRGHLGGRVGRLNLRRGDAAYTRDYEHLKGRVGALAAGAVLVLLLAVGSASVKVFALSRQEQVVDRALCDAQTKILGKCFEDAEVALGALRGRGIPGASIPRVSAVDVLGDLSQRIPDGVALRYDRIDVTDKKIHLQGTTDTAENVDRIVASLHGSKCFVDARPQGVRKRAGDAKFEFSVDSALGCLDGLTGRE